MHFHVLTYFLFLPESKYCCGFENIFVVNFMCFVKKSFQLPVDRFDLGSLYRLLKKALQIKVLKVEETQKAKRKKTW